MKKKIWVSGLSMQKNSANTPPHTISGGGDLPKQEQSKDGAKMEEYNFTGYKVLLIEDNDLNREIAKELLEAVGLDVDTAENGKEALEKFLNSEPHMYLLILMDIEMPVMNGFEATKGIRGSSHKCAETIPILAMTGSIFAEDITIALDAGMNEYITKPIDTNQLYKVIRSYIKK